jgi:hypothetical protein
MNVKRFARAHRAILIVVALWTALLLVAACSGVGSSTSTSHAALTSNSALMHRPPRHHPTPAPSTPSPSPTTPSPTPTTPSPSPSATANGTFTGPAAPAGWTVTYQRNFASTAGQGDWVTQPGNNAPVIDSTKPGAEFGLGIELTAVSQWTEIISSDAVVGPNSYVQGLVYIPSGSGGPNPYGNTFPAGSSANWPAFWTFGNPWPQNGEIDMLEVQNGKSCEQTHYSATPGSSTEGNSVSNCAALDGTGTGWVTVSMLRQNEEVKVWYGNTYMGEVPLPTTADEKLVWQNQSYSDSVCGNCFGPTVLGSASTAWLSNVRVYAPAS